MRRQYRSFVVTMIVVSLCCGFVGCKLSPGRPWYKPNSYVYNNPFKKGAAEEDEYSRFAEDSNGIRLPSEGQNPDLSIPRGGYSDDGRSQVAQGASIPRTGTPIQNHPQNQSVAMTGPQPGYGMQGQGQGQFGAGQTMPVQHSVPANLNPQYPQQYSTVPQNAVQNVQNTAPQQSYDYQQPGYNNQPGGYTQQNQPVQYQSQPQLPMQSQYDQNYGAMNSGYATGQNNYYNDEYRPGTR